jgi:probable H4MPT-linked C1 transfer pathway protein
MRTLGLDIGGANLKGATSSGRAATVAFPLWKSPEKLAETVEGLARRLAGWDRLAVTMTGELADCFATKEEGVSQILAAIEHVAKGAPISVWTTSGRFVSPREAREEWPRAAAANWHALATWAGRLVSEGFALLLDIGSTTTDIIPLRDGVPRPAGKTDVERLLSGELVYTGVRRTPLCAVLQQAELRGGRCRLAAELFATTLDAYLVLAMIPPDPTDCETANGRPATLEHAHDRLARMACCDRTELTCGERRSLAEQCRANQAEQIRAAIDQVVQRQGETPAAILASGSGTFLAHYIIAGAPRLSGARFIDLGGLFSPEVAQAACAYAVACLADDLTGA